MENQGFEQPLKSSREGHEDKEIVRLDAEGVEKRYFVRQLEREEKIELLNGQKEEVGKLVFSPVQYDAEKLRVLDVRVNEEERGNNLGVELYKQLISIAEQKHLDGIVSTNHVSFGAAAIWKKLGDEGYLLKVNPNAEPQYRDFLEKHSNGEKGDGDIAIQAISGETNAVFEIGLQR